MQSTKALHVHEVYNVSIILSTYLYEWMESEFVSDCIRFGLMYLTYHHPHPTKKSTCVHESV